MKNWPQAIVVGDPIGLITNDNMRIAAMATRSEKGNPDITIIYPSRGFVGMVIEHKKEGTVLKNKDGSWRKQTYTRKYRKGGKLYISTGDHIAEQVATLYKYKDNGFFGCFTIGRYSLKRRIDWFFENLQTEMF